MAQYDQNGEQIVLSPGQINVNAQALATGDVVLGSTTPYQVLIGEDTIQLVPSVAVTANDTAYWTFVFGYYKQDGTLVTAATFSTKTTSGGGLGTLVIGTPVTIELAAFTVPARATWRLGATETGSATDPGFVLNIPYA